MRKNSPDSMDCEIRTMSCGTTRPAPRFKCPTSLLPIWPSGSPTASPEASSNVCGARSHSRCQVGVVPSSMALPSRPGRNPQPSSTIRTTGMRGPRLLVILKGMQVSDIIRALPVVLSLAAPLVLKEARAQGRQRVTNDGEWFYQEAGGRRLARLARGAIVGGGETRGEWMQVTLDGWIFATSVGPSPRPDFDLVVTRAPDENLRSAPGGALVAKLAEGFRLKRLSQDDRWVRVTRDGWGQRSALEPVAHGAATRTAAPPDSGAAQGASPAHGAGDSLPVKPSGDGTPARVQPAHVTTLY